MDRLGGEKEGQVPPPTQCPHCNRGYMIPESDGYGMFSTCLNCGYNDYGSSPAPDIGEGDEAWTLDEARKAIEQRSGKRLSDEVWEDVSAGNSRYLAVGKADYDEIVERVECHPATIAVAIAQEAVRFAADVGRLRRLVLSFSLDDDIISILARGLESAWKLDHLVEGGDLAALVALRGGPSPAEIATTALEISAATAAEKAIDWLAKEYCIPWALAEIVLCGDADASQIPLTLFKTSNVGRPSPTTAKLVRQIDDEPRVRATAVDIRRFLRMRRNETQALLWRMISVDGGLWEGWDGQKGRIDYKRLWGSWGKGWIEYEALAQRRAIVSRGASPEHFGNSRTFRQAAIRVAERLWQYRARIEGRRLSG